MRIFIDVDGTIQDHADRPRLAVIGAIATALARLPHAVPVVWSGGGRDYARDKTVEHLGFLVARAAVLAKDRGVVLAGDIVVDDQPWEAGPGALDLPPGVDFRLVDDFVAAVQDGSLFEQHGPILSAEEAVAQARGPTHIYTVATSEPTDEVVFALDLDAAMENLGDLVHQEVETGDALVAWPLRLHAYQLTEYGAYNDGGYLVLIDEDGNETRGLLPVGEPEEAWLGEQEEV